MNEEQKPLLFREHRGGYSESMQTVQEVKDIHGLCTILATILDLRTVGYDTFWLEYEGLDIRNGWNTFLVHHTTGVVGYTNGEFSKTTLPDTERPCLHPPECDYCAWCGFDIREG